MTDTSILEAEMTATLALALSDCPNDGACAPRCRHCRATSDEVEAARRWVAAHPVEIDVWRAQKLGEIDVALQLWRVLADIDAEGRWAVGRTDGCESTLIVANLSRQQAEAVAAGHNAERDTALAIVDWYTGA